MTAPPEFGAAIPTNGVRWGGAIPVNGIRPSWLPDDVLIDFSSGGEWLTSVGGGGGITAGRCSIGSGLDAIRLERPRYDFVYLALERGMVPWLGGDEAPGDVLEDSRVLFRDGLVGSSADMLRWNHFGTNADIIGYTRKATSTALPLAHPAAPQGEDTVIVPRVPTEAMIAAGSTQCFKKVPPMTMASIWSAMLAAALDPAAIASGREGGGVMDDDLVCCEWCGDEFPPEQMATAGLCNECIEVADLEEDTPA